MKDPNDTTAQLSTRTDNLVAFPLRLGYKARKKLMSRAGAISFQAKR